MYEWIHGDCVEELQKMDKGLVDICIFSPPFADLYVYSDDVRDLGNSKNYEEFFEHFSYVIPGLARVMKPGRLVIVHCMDLPIQKGKEGFIGLRDFSGMIVKAFEKESFIYHSRVTIWKDPVVEMQRTKALGLLHKQVKKDAVMSRVGIPDYLLVFRNSGDNLVPVVHQSEDSSRENYLPVDLWQKYASPIWHDINYTRTLQYRSARDKNDEKHICPLQLETIRRCLHLWSNEGELSLDIFGGIASTGHESILLNRRFKGIELKKSYHDQGLRNLQSAVNRTKQKILF